ncbi:hypothetical protein ACLMJK_000771 [Lecanora helva]
MYAASSICMLTYLIPTFLTSVAAITLNQWQPITGFSQACVNAYNTPLTGCTASDFEQAFCSTDCISFLEALTKILVAECGGANAYPNTLIGSFFKGEGTTALCPNVLGESNNNDNTYTLSVGQASTYVLNSDNSLSATTASVFTGPLISAAPSQPSSLATSSASSSSISGAATTTVFAVAHTTVPPETNAPTYTFSPTSTDQSTSQGSSSTSTSSTSAATSSGGDNNGGGSPLDVGSSTSSSSRSAKKRAWILDFMVGFAGLMLFF